MSALALQPALLHTPSEPTFALRDYQEEAIAAILAARARAVQRQLLVMATGGGKTIVFSHLAHRLGVRTLILAHREELIEQAASKLRAVVGSAATVGVVKAERNEIHADLLVGSIQTVSMPRRLRQLPPDLGLVVADECHHCRAETWMRTLEHLGCWRPGGPLLVGVTATPDRADGKPIGDRIFQEEVYRKTMLDLIEAGYLCDVRAIAVHIAADLGTVHTRGGDLDSGELARLLLHANAPRRVLEAYQQHAAGRKALAFTPDVRMAYELARTFREAGIAAEAIDGTTHPELRRATLRRLASGETRVVANCAVLTEGFDEPSVDCLLICRPTKSRPLYVQMLGRGMRIHPGKENCLVLDLCGNAGKHDVASVPSVFGLAEDRQTESVLTAVREKRAQSEARERAEAEDDARAALVSQEVRLFRRQGFHWLPVERREGSPLLVLGYGSGLVKLGETAPGAWAVVANDTNALPRLLGRELDRGAAQRLAEQHARTHGHAWAYRSDARWRSQPVSDKTRVFARSLGLTLPKDCTAGEATDRITAKKALVLGTGRSQTTPPGAERYPSS